KAEHEKRVARIKEAREQEIQREQRTTPRHQQQTQQPTTTTTTTYTPRYNNKSSDRSGSEAPHLVMVVHGLLFLIFSLALGSLPTTLTPSTTSSDSSPFLADSTHVQRIRTDFILNGAVMLVLGAVLMPRYLRAGLYSRLVAGGTIACAYLN